VQEIGDAPGVTSQQTLALLATRLGELGYGSYAAYSLEGNDNRGIDTGFLVKSNITVLTPATHTIGTLNGLTAAGTCSDITGRLFDRPPLWIQVDLGPLAGGATWLASNHFASKAAPDSCRDAQATFVKDQAAALGSGAKAIVMGDLNAFEDETPLANLQSGGLLDNLWDTVPGEEAYSFQFNGVLQTLDHVAVTANVNNIVNFRYAHIDQHYFERNPSDAHKVSDHDPPVLTLGAAEVVPQFDGWVSLLMAAAAVMAVGVMMRRRRDTERLISTNCSL
jgi:hypothetical protein